MTSKRKQLSNTFSTGGGGPHFEAHVQASYVVLMLTGGYAPCLPCWPIEEIKLQGKVDGFDTDDLIVFVRNPDGDEPRKLLAQVKHGLQVGDNERFRAVIQAAWDDFNNPKQFNKKKDVIAAISDGLSTTELASVQSLLNEAQHPLTEEFIRKVNLARYNSTKTRDVLAVFRKTLKKANNNIDPSDPELHEFLRHFRLLGYDLGEEEGVVLSLLHSHISQCCSKPPKDVWGKIVDFVQTCNQNARPITKETLPEDLLDDFRPPVVETFPEEFMLRSLPSPPNMSVQTYSHDLAQAFLIGGWIEGNEGDIEVVTELTKTEYDKWIPSIREALETPDSPLVLRNGTWTTKRREDSWKQLGNKLYDTDLDRFETVAVKVLSEANPAFELPGDERYMANVKGKILRYSRTIREGIADTLAVMGSCPHLFSHCAKNKPENVALMVVRNVLSIADWQIWGSLNYHLPLLAEASPGEFLSAVEGALQLESCPFLELFAQEDSGVMGNNYMTGLLWALETLAWDEQHLTRVAVILGELSMIDPGGNWSNRPKNSLTTIFLPWLPQTTASIEKRLTAIRTLVKEVPSSAWQMLINLLPNKHQISSGSHKPRWWLDIPDKAGERVPMKEYWDQVSCYAELALQMAGSDTIKLKILIDSLNNLPPEAFNDLLNLLESDVITSLPEKERTNLWSALVEFTARHRRFADAKWTLKEDVLKRIDAVAMGLTPKDPSNLHRMLFSGREFYLYDLEEGEDWDEKEKKLKERRQAAIGDIYEGGGLEAVLEFVETVDSVQKVGAAFGVIASDQEDIALLPKLLNEKQEEISRFISSYIWARQWKVGWEWVDRVLSSDWTSEQLCVFFRGLPFCPETWKRVTDILGENEEVYWKSILFNPFQAKDDFETAIDKLLEHGRPYASIDCLNASRHMKNPLDHQRAIKALLAAVSTDESPESLVIYECIELIKALQDDPDTDQDALINIEWAYLAALDGHLGTTPKLLEYKLASDPNFFCEVIRIVFRSRHDDAVKSQSTEREQNLASHAYRLLDEWRTPPGTMIDATFSPDAFLKWMSEMKEICLKTGHLEVAMLQTGKVLIHTAPDLEGLWIHTTVAEALNAKDAEKMRSGFRTGIYNSRGVHKVDPTGQPERDLAEKYKSQGDAAEEAGYYRLSTTMRSLSDSYTREAERVIEEHQAE